eukprot:TRINITY_DN888_c0_g2_i1.p1 TRINITY_DN888_c0_g2~~TRINITY_DN888_c0_g2_i1.p1  ORF type:complete len:233 (+),score=37.26 TRINITY_DN888_c0_g2_i1:161-859(+)
MCIRDSINAEYMGFDWFLPLPFRLEMPMIQESLRRYILRPVVVAFLVLQAGWAGAQLPDKLPPAPDYRGEIRRTPDGRLMVLSEEAKLVRAADLPATMSVGPGQKISTLTEAARLAKDGEVIEIHAGDQERVEKKDKPEVPRREGKRTKTRYNSGMNKKKTGIQRGQRQKKIQRQQGKEGSQKDQKEKNKRKVRKRKEQKERRIRQKIKVRKKRSKLKSCLLYTSPSPRDQA